VNHESTPSFDVANCKPTTSMPATPSAHSGGSASSTHKGMNLRNLNLEIVVVLRVS
jgi:hypothetical protein